MKILRNLFAFTALLCLIQNSFASALVQLSLSGLPSTVNTYQTYDNVILTITNPATAPLFLNQLSDTQYPKGFTQTATTCTNILLAANAQCMVTGNFTPTQAGTNTWSVKLAAENYVWTTPYTVSVTVQQAPRPPDELDSQLQNDIDSLYAQFETSPAFSAVQLSVLLPDETEPRDYVVGTQSVENPNVPATTTMLTQYGSITKEFTSALIIKYMYAHPGAITLQTTLAQLFPTNFPPQGDWPLAWRNINVEQLMNMTSGIPSYTTPVILNPYDQYTLAQLVDLMAVEQNTQGCILDNGCFIPAGSQYFYSNTNYIILGMLIENLYGQDYADVLNENILQAQQAQGNSVYYILKYPADILANMLNGYYGGSTPVPYLQPNQNVTDINLSVAASAGAITGSTHALVNFIYALFNNQILSEEQTTFLTQTGFVTTPTDTSPGGVPVPFSEAQEKCGNSCYGLGVSYQYAPAFGFFYLYGGSTPGYNTIYIWLPKYNAVVGMTINTTSDDIYNYSITNTYLVAIQQVISHITSEPIAATNTLSTHLFNAEFRRSMLRMPK
jgi:D-alanyl-D-alanine carboxypeptidase